MIPSPETRNPLPSATVSPRESMLRIVTVAGIACFAISAAERGRVCAEAAGAASPADARQMVSKRALVRMRILLRLLFHARVVGAGCNPARHARGGNRHEARRSASAA